MKRNPPHRRKRWVKRSETHTTELNEYKLLSGGKGVDILWGGGVEVAVDSGSIITGAVAVVGTMGGALLSYWVQGRVAERQRRWALQDEERHRQRSLEDERRKLKHDLLEKRLALIEEAVTLMSSDISATEGLELSLPIPTNQSLEIKKKLRLQDIYNGAWCNVQAMGSEELRLNWSTLLSVYWDLQQSGVVGSDHKKASDAQRAIIRLLDEMRLQD